MLIVKHFLMKSFLNNLVSFRSHIWSFSFLHSWGINYLLFTCYSLSHGKPTVIIQIIDVFFMQIMVLMRQYPKLYLFNWENIFKILFFKILMIIAVFFSTFIICTDVLWPGKHKAIFRLIFLFYFIDLIISKHSFPIFICLSMNFLRLSYHMLVYFHHLFVNYWENLLKITFQLFICFIPFYLGLFDNFLSLNSS